MNVDETIIELCSVGEFKTVQVATLYTTKAEFNAHV